MGTLLPFGIGPPFQAGVGHFLMLENPRAFNEHLLAFLKKQGVLRSSD